MKKRYVIPLIALISLALFSSLTGATTLMTLPAWEELPKLEAQHLKVIKTEDARIDALTVTEEVDYIPGPGTTSGIDTVVAWGANQSWAPSASYGFNALQCRDVWPEEAAGGDEGKTPGETTSPMNYSSFRVALTYIFGMDDKNTSIFNYYQGPQTFGIQSVIPPAQAAWWDPTATLPPTSYATAWALLEAAGFNATGGTLRDPNGIPCRDLVMYYSTGATAWEMMLPDMVGNFNDFMDNYLGVTNCDLELRSKDFAALVYGNLLATHDYDMIGIGLTGLGADCDWIVSMFHSDYDVPWGWNFAGVHDDYVDMLMDLIMYSMDGEVIKQACNDFQHYFNGEMPASAIAYQAAHPEWDAGCGQWPHYLWTSGMTIQSYHPDLEDFIEMPCYGSEQCELTWAYLTWGEGATPAIPGAVRRAVGDEPTNLNPFYENTLYGWLLALDGPLEGLARSHPNDLNPIPWLAQHYAYEEFSGTTPSGQVIADGMKIDYYLREGIYWQDSGAYEDLNDNDQWDEGEPKYEFEFTAFDCKFAADMYMKHEVGRYDTVWTEMVEVATHDKYHFTVYYGAKSYWYSTYPASLSFYPMHIYQKADKMVDDGTMENFQDFKPAFTSYEDWMGIHPPDEWGTPPTGPGKPGYWSALVGTGPFIFGYYNVETMIGEMYDNPSYWGGLYPLQQSIKTKNEHYGIKCYKEELAETTVTLENTTVFNPSAPPCSYWHETAPTPSRGWHICGWDDTNKDGLVSASDQVTLCRDVCGNGQWSGQGEYHVDSIVWNEVTGKWTMVVRKKTYTPKSTHTYIAVDFTNMWRWLSIDVYYDVFIDDVKVADGWVYDVDSWDYHQILVNIEDWDDFPTCKHTYRVDFYGRRAGTTEDLEFSCSTSRVFAHIVADTNCDCKVDMKDIYNVILAFGAKPGDPRYDPACDINNDGKVDMKDIYITIRQFGKKCTS